MRETHVLVTGGAGFIGSHLCERLVMEGNQVLCLDNFFTGRKRNIAHLLALPNFELFRHDITVPLTLEVDQVFHLACPASPIFYRFDPIKTVETCVLGTINALRVANKCRARFVLTSTSEVYGDPDCHPQPEDYNGNVDPGGVRACYDEGKRVSETLVSDYRRQYGLDGRVARLFNTFGPNMAVDDGRVISNFIVQSIRTEPITLYGDGSQTRSFCFVDDIVEALIRLMQSEVAWDGPVNLGNPVERSIRSVAEQVLEMCDSVSTIEYQSLPSGNPKRRCPDISRAKALLDWEPTTDFKTGLLRTIDYFAKLLTES